MAAIVLSTNRNDDLQGDTQPKGATDMQHPDLTKWLEMVWDALDEQDALKRACLLNAADALLQGGNQPHSAPQFADSTRAAA